MIGVRKLSPAAAALQRTVVEQFEAGSSVFAIAKYHGVAAQTVERLIRHRLAFIGKMVPRCD